MKIALVHDYLREYGGAERVLEALHEIWPKAPVYVGFFDKKALGIHAPKFKSWDIRETSITKLPFYKQLFSPYRIFAKQAFENLDLSKYDLVISSSNAYMAKAVRVPNGKHICYCHTPPRSLYGYSTKSDWRKNIFTRVIGELINHQMRIWDFQVAQRVDLFIANSEETKKRIKKFYRRDAKIIYPPVDINIKNINKNNNNKNYYLYVNRLALAKHPELAVKAAIKLNLNLKIAGSGPMLAELKQLAENKNNIKFYGAVSDQELNNLYAGARGLIYPVEDEDFGMVPVEAMMHGVPVIAHRSGGPKESIIDGKTGLFFDDLSVKGLSEAILKFQKLKFNKKIIKKHASKFNKINFKDKIKKLTTQFSLTQ